MGALLDLVSQNVASAPGTGTITLGAASTGFRTLAAAMTAASLSDGIIVSYVVLDGTNREVAIGVVGGSGTTITRGTLYASSTGAFLNLTSNAVVWVGANAADLFQNVSANSILARADATNGAVGEVAIGLSQLFGRGASGDLTPITLGTNLSMSGSTLNAVSDVYPYSNFGPRYRSWFMDPNDTLNFANGAGPFGDRYFLHQDNTVTWSRVLIPSGNGRVALRRQVVNYTPSDTGRIRGQSGNNFILDPDAGAVWRWKARVNLRPNGQSAPDETTHRYSYVCGFSTWTSTPQFASNCAIFRYYYDTSGESPALQAITRRNGSGQTSDLVYNFADAFVTLEVVMSATQVMYYINGALVATHTTAPDGALNDGDSFFREGHTGTVIMDLAYMATSVSWENDA